MIDILLYSAALALEFIALLVLLTIAPFAFASIVLFARLSELNANQGQILAVVIAMISGVILYVLRRGGLKSESKK